ncbi:family transcriptional regulator [Leptolyngbya sp. Heron Island J]|uniref:LysR substrate-binding domain-containing protein n=1 Tax=Leptolyngbya sp. Heron Island J TaxID=1385935 RepID=UPI0003B97655|nr:LysR substrate-binding domain-containing protein [Leptolyngbya sp. Heron Island J]ESA34878.1 family transcriptional regulator [Leptolyngbya sp. Heron Island J]
MELRHLRYFLAVAEELHFGRAAQRLHIAQQPLSRQIRNLEDELGILLFHRTKRRIRLTQAGQVFLQETRKTLAQADHAVVMAQRVGQGVAGQLSIGFTGPMLNRILPTVVREFKQRFPEIHLSLQRLPTNDQVKSLLADEIHVGFLHPPIDASLLKQTVIYQEPMIALLPDFHPLAKDAPAPISIKSLANESFILFPRQVGPVLYDAIISFCQQADFSPNVVQEAFPQQTIMGLVAAGLGVSLIHASIQQIHQPGVVARPLIEPSPVLESAVAWRSDLPHPALTHFLELVQELF